MNKPEPSPKPKLKPSVVQSRRRKINEQIDALLDKMKETIRRCSHEGKIERYIEYEDSGFECRACGQTWNRHPEAK